MTSFSTFSTAIHSFAPDYVVDLTESSTYIRLTDVPAKLSTNY